MSDRTGMDFLDEVGGPAMSLGEHLEELRRRLIYSIATVAGAFILCWVFKYRLLQVLKAPHVQAMRSFGHDIALNYRGYFEPIAAQLKVCLIAAAVLTSPFLIYQAWAFIAPGLFPHERFKVVRLGLASLAGFLAGIGFGYFLFIPIALRYMVMLAGPGTRPVLMINDYVSLFFMLTLALAIVFQTPVVVAYLIRWNIIEVESLQRHRKAAILVAFVLAAVLTPPDPLTQLMMGVTLVMLYDLGGLIAAPSATTIKAFARFAGVIAVVLAGVLAWLEFWPVARVTALRGNVQAGERVLETDQPARIRRGTQISGGPDAVARVEFGSADGPSVHIAGGGALRVHSAEKASAMPGTYLAESPAESHRLELYAGPATVTVAGARAEVVLHDPDTLTVRAFDGTVEVNQAGTDSTVKSGRERTFYSGGEPADLTEERERWRQLLGGAAAPRTR